jgi:phage terminase small subunit
MAKEKNNALVALPEPPAEVVINDDFSYISPKDGKTYTLTQKEKLFCECYLQFFGNGVQAVFEAGYKVKNAKVAAAIAYENLRKPHLMAYIDTLLEEYGFNDENVERQHRYVLNQYADLAAKNKAIDMYYKLRGSYAPEKKDVRVGVYSLSDLRRKMKEKSLQVTDNPDA